MAYMKFKGLDEYLVQLQRIEKNTEEHIGKVVYAMADIVADEIRSNIDSLSAVPDAEALVAYQKGTSAPLTVSQKKGLQDGFGISKMQEENGYWNVKLGFAGYNSTKTKKYPQGQPNVMIARSVESGSSIRNKTPFVRPAVNKAKSAAEQKAKEILDKEIQKDM